jgi:hypothetical protein
VDFQGSCGPSSDIPNTQSRKVSVYGVDLGIQFLFQQVAGEFHSVVGDRRNRLRPFHRSVVGGVWDETVQETTIGAHKRDRDAHAGAPVDGFHRDDPADCPNHDSFDLAAASRKMDFSSIVRSKSVTHDKVPPLYIEARRIALDR